MLSSTCLVLKGKEHLHFTHLQEEVEVMVSVCTCVLWFTSLCVEERKTIAMRCPCLPKERRRMDQFQILVADARGVLQKREGGAGR